MPIRTDAQAYMLHPHIDIRTHVKQVQYVLCAGNVHHACPEGRPQRDGGHGRGHAWGRHLAAPQPLAWAFGQTVLGLGLHLFGFCSEGPPNLEPHHVWEPWQGEKTPKDRILHVEGVANAVYSLNLQ